MKNFVTSLVCALALSGCYVIEPAERGVSVRLGHMDEHFLAPGWGPYFPLTTDIYRVNVQQQAETLTAACFSSDLQQVSIKVRVLYRIPETSVVAILRDYSGNPFDTLITPRVQEAIKEITATATAADIVKTREAIKFTALNNARAKISDLLILEDLVIEDVSLSKELETAIEAKMVQQQEAEKAVFKMQQAQTDAETALIKARADAESIRIQGEALDRFPRLVDLKMVEKWNGVAPQVVGTGSSIMLPLEKGK